LQFSHQSRILERSPTWKLRASHSPWRLPPAFDNSPVTMWSSEQRRREGMFVKVEFGYPHPIDRSVAKIP
jgi:hypothetical protein